MSRLYYSIGKYKESYPMARKQAIVSSSIKLTNYEIELVRMFRDIEIVANQLLKYKEENPGVLRIPFSASALLVQKADRDITSNNFVTYLKAFLKTKGFKLKHDQKRDKFEISKKRKS